MNSGQQQQSRHEQQLVKCYDSTTSQDENNNLIMQDSNKSQMKTIIFLGLLYCDYITIQDKNNKESGHILRNTE